MNKVYVVYEELFNELAVENGAVHLLAVFDNFEKAVRDVYNRAVDEEFNSKENGKEYNQLYEGYMAYGLNLDDEEDTLNCIRNDKNVLFYYNDDEDSSLNYEIHIKEMEVK